jgi:hypothetical protein
MNDIAPMNEVQRSRKSMWRMRWLLVGLSALLAVVLIASGAVLIGALIGVMAAVRTVMILQWQRQRGRLHQES